VCRPASRRADLAIRVSKNSQGMMGHEVAVTLGDVGRGGAGRVAFPARERGEGEESLRRVNSSWVSGSTPGLNLDSCDSVDR
jgi:hypothetical protein